MRQILPLLALFCTAGTLSAQALSTHPIAAPSNLRTVTQAGVFAGNRVRSLPAGAHISHPVYLRARAPGSRVDQVIAPIREPGVIGARFAWSAKADSSTTTTDVLAQAGTTGDGSPQFSVQRYQLLVPAGDVGKGTLVIEFKGKKAEGEVEGEVASALITIEGEFLDFTATDAGVSKRVVVEDLMVGDAGLVVNVAITGFVNGTMAPSSYEAAISLRFRANPPPPQVCKVEPDHRGCMAGGELTGRVLGVGTTDRNQNHIVLRLQGALPIAIGLTILSRKGDVGRFAFTDCPILGNPIVVGVFRTDGHGNASRSLPVPRVSGDLSFFIQQVTVKLGGNAGIRIASSNTLAAKCSH